MTKEEMRKLYWEVENAGEDAIWVIRNWMEQHYPGGLHSLIDDELAECHAFVASIFLSSTEGREEMTEDDAGNIIANWERDGVDVPYALTPYLLHEMWNAMLDEESERTE